MKVYGKGTIKKKETHRKVNDCFTKRNIIKDLLALKGENEARGE